VRKTKAQLQEEIDELREEISSLKKRLHKYEPKLKVGGDWVTVCKDIEHFFSVEAKLSANFVLALRPACDLAVELYFDKPQIPDLIRFLNEDVSPLLEESNK
jgi:hypothetical protein